MSEDRLRPLWDTFDIDGSEKQLRAALATETTDPGRAEVLTQLARVELSRGRIQAAHSLLDEADKLAGDSRTAQARVLLERGRVVRKSDGDAGALPILEQAYHSALEAGQHFMAADAAHSCALAGDMVVWTDRGLDLADRFEAAAYWRGTLLMNLGDWQWGLGEHARSLESFEAALDARERDQRNPALTEYARFGVARALRGLDRSAEAVPHLEQAVQWLDRSGLTWPEGQLFRQELAAAYDDVGRPTAAEAARRAASSDPGVS